MQFDILRVPSTTVYKATRLQVIEVTDAGRQFLLGRFAQFDRNKDGMLSTAEQDEMFSTAPSRWANHSRPREQASAGSLRRPDCRCRALGRVVPLAAWAASLRPLRGFICKNCAFPGGRFELLAAHKSSNASAHTAHQVNSSGTCEPLPCGCSPWAGAPYEGLLVERGPGGLTRPGFLAKWAALTARAPKRVRFPPCQIRFFCRSLTSVPPSNWPSTATKADFDEPSGV